MAAQKTTPEEKLFAVIQGAAAPSPRARAQTLSIGAVFSQAQGALSSIELPRVNQALLIAIALLGAFALIAPLLMQPQMDHVLQQAAKQSVPFLMEPPLQGLKTTEDVVQLMRSQDPFHVGDTLPGAAPAAGLPPAVSPPADSHQLLADLRLVGISFGAVPTAMIEQTSQQKTNVLKAGEQVGQFTVKEIQRDRVILQLGDQDLELF